MTWLSLQFNFDAIRERRSLSVAVAAGRGVWVATDEEIVPGSDVKLVLALADHESLLCGCASCNFCPVSAISKWSRIGETHVIKLSVNLQFLQLHIKCLVSRYSLFLPIHVEILDFFQLFIQIREECQVDRGERRQELVQSDRFMVGWPMRRSQRWPTQTQRSTSGGGQWL